MVNRTGKEKLQFYAENFCLSKPVIDFVYFSRLLCEGICHEKNIPSISSINRIIRDKAILQRRSLDSLSGVSLSDQCMSDSEEVSIYHGDSGNIQ